MKSVNYRRRCALFFAAALWMALIFCLSSQKAAESGELSGTLSYRMAKGINSLFSLGWEEETLLLCQERWDYPVRKGAHMTEYAILAWIVLLNYREYPRLRRHRYLWAWLSASAYAITDEFHQLFVEGRSGEWKDAGIDSIGAAIGLAAAYGIAFFAILYQRRKR